VTETPPEGAVPRRAEAGWPPVVVAGAYNTGVVLMRDLGRRGVATSCVDHNPAQPGFRTVYGRGDLCPNPDTDPAGWRDFMIELAGRLGGRPVLIPSADQFVSAMAAHADALEPHYVFSREGLRAQALLAEKDTQYELAAEHGLPVPRTRTVTSAAEVRDFAAAARFPCLLKPKHAREWEGFPHGHPLAFQKLVLAEDADALATAYARAAEAVPTAVVQEVIVGPDTSKYVYLSCYGRGARRLGWCTVRERRTLPMSYGSGSLVEPVRDDEVESVCDAFFRRIGLVGVCEVELKRDSRDGRLLLIEANPRYSVTADAATYAGVELGWLHYLDLLGHPVEPVTWDGREFRHVVLLRDVPAWGAYRRAGLETWRSILRTYRPPLGFYDFDLRDWRVSWATIRTLARYGLGSLYRAVFRRRPR
jgi:predicted ATP-grasp superfamily ATP-dependent carboligase